MSISSAEPIKPISALLEGIPYIGYGMHLDGSYEFDMFPSALKACLNYLSDPCNYEYLAGTSGSCFRLVWHPHVWDPSNIGILRMDNYSPEPVARAFRAIGRSFEYFTREPWSDDPAAQKPEDDLRMRKMIVESLDHGIPVIAFGVVGPPEPSVITGYEDEGQVLLGRSYFQDFAPPGQEVETVPAGTEGSRRYFRVAGWEKDTQAIVVIGPKINKLPQRSIDLEALKWAVSLARKSSLGEHIGGLAAYQAWAEDLLRDEDFKEENPRKLADAQIAHDDATMMVGDYRPNAAKFIRRIASEVPEVANELEHAAALFQGENDLMKQVWKVMGDMDEGRAARLARPETRRHLSDLILKCRDNDAMAIKAIEAAIEKFPDQPASVYSWSMPGRAMQISECQPSYLERPLADQ